MLVNIRSGVQLTRKTKLPYLRTTSEAHMHDPDERHRLVELADLGRVLLPRGTLHGPAFLVLLTLEVGGIDVAGVKHGLATERLI